MFIPAIITHLFLTKIIWFLKPSRREKMFSIFGYVAEAVPMVLDGRIDDAMGKFNGVTF